MQSILQEIRNFIPAKHHDNVFLVGGLVRDDLTGQLKGELDVDLVAHMPTEDILRLGAVLIESKSAAPVYLLKHEKFGNVQIARPRTETKTGFGYHGFEYQVLDHRMPIKEALVHDLRRRDFTVNAMVRSLDGSFFDPFGGVHHLKGRELHHVSDFFKQDPIRVFRAYRFCARGYHLSPKTREYIQSLDLSADFAALPVERIFPEVEKALKATHPHRFFAEMVRIGQGKEFFPEVFRMLSIPAGPAEYHPEGDLFTHSYQVLQKVAAKTSDPVARCAAFFHDIGKLLTPIEEYPKHLGHAERGEELARTMLNRLRAPGKYAKATALVSLLHMKAERFSEMRPSRKLAFAEKASPVADMLVHVVMADGGVDLNALGFAEVSRIAGLSATKLGIPVEKLQAMAPHDIQALVTQKKVELLKAA